VQIEKTYVHVDAGRKRQSCLRSPQLTTSLMRGERILWQKRKRQDSRRNGQLVRSGFCSALVSQRNARA
jgi:hypothetical protein